MCEVQTWAGAHASTTSLHMNERPDKVHNDVERPYEISQSLYILESLVMENEKGAAGKEYGREGAAEPFITTIHMLTVRRRTIATNNDKTASGRLPSVR